MQEQGTKQRTWVKITCEESELLRAGLHVHSARTDPEGVYGPPEVFTEWGTDAGPVLRDHRFPQPDFSRPDVKPCEHEALR